MWKYCGLIDLLINHIGFKVINTEKKKSNYSNQRPILKATYLMQTTKDTRCGIKVDNKEEFLPCKTQYKDPIP